MIRVDAKAIIVVSASMFSSALYAQECVPQCAEPARTASSDDRLRSRIRRGWCCRTEAPPAGPVVSSVPAVMLAQPAVAVSPVFLRHQVFEVQAQERAKEVQAAVDATLKKISEGSAASNASVAPASNPALSRDDVRALTTAIQSMNSQIVELNAEVDSLRKRLEEAK